MQPRIYWILASAALFLATGCNAATEKAQSAKEKSIGNQPYNSFPDDLYLDDQDAFEGSGHGGDEVRDDLESSGSGFGPDDEDGESPGPDDNTVVTTSTKPEEPKPPVTEDTNIKTKQTHVEEDNKLLKSGGGEHTNERDYIDSENEIQGVHMNPKHDDKASSFFAQPGVLAAVIGGAVVGLLCAILVVMFIVYRMRKKDEGSYALDEPRRSPAAQAYPKPGAPHHNREFYA